MKQTIQSPQGKVIIDTQINYVYEAFSLLLHIATGIKYEDIYQKLDHQFPGSLKNERFKFDVLQTIENNLLNLLDQNKELEDDLKYYFHVDAEYTDCFANLALPFYEFSGYHPCEFDDFAEHLSSMTEAEYNQTFGFVLQGYHQRIHNELEYISFTDSIALTRFIMNMEIDSSRRWQILQIYSNPELHRSKILHLIQVTIQIIKQEETALKKIGTDFLSYWSKQFQEKSPSSLISETYYIHVFENSDEIKISPLFFHPVWLRTYMPCSYYDFTDEIRIGILFDETFSIYSLNMNISAEYKDYALHAAKLLSDKSKFEILCYIKNKKAYGSELAKQLGLTTATISHHMSSLHDAELVNMEKDENRINYTIVSENIKRLLEFYREQLL